MPLVLPRALTVVPLLCVLACGSDRATGTRPLAFVACNTNPVVVPTADWPVNCPGAVGLDTAKLRQAWATLAGYRGPLSLLVIRNGQLVMESYYQGTLKDVLFEQRSVTKSVTSALIGIELLRGKLDTTGRTIGDLIPQFVESGADPRISAETLEQLMSMRSGWVGGQVVAPSLVGSFVNRSLSYVPGTSFYYDDGTYHVVSAMVRQVADTAPLDLANRYLFGPMGITVTPNHWTADELGINLGYSGLKLTSREMAKLGYLYLHDGVWDGQRLIDSVWVDRSTRQQSQAGADYGNMGYGFGWWMTPYGGHAGYSAIGYGGQTVTVIPDLDMVVVITGDPYDSNVNWAVYRQVIPDYIVPAAGN